MTAVMKIDLVGPRRRVWTNVRFIPDGVLGRVHNGKRMLGGADNEGAAA
jgi:hypothetical protein